MDGPSVLRIGGRIFLQVAFDSLLDYTKLLSFLYVSLSKQQSTHQSNILAVHDVTEPVLVRGDCRSSARPRIENRPASFIAARNKISRVPPAVGNE